MDFTTAEPIAHESPAEQSPTPRAPTPYTITITLIAINVLVFLAMLASGVFTNLTLADAHTWGFDYGPWTVDAHQWWRLFTSTFLHFSILHIGMNMFVLYQIGPFIETVFGRIRYLLIYFIAGLFGSLVSVWIHPLSVSAGASGAIFGLYGAVFGFLLIERRTLNPAATKSIAQSAGIFVLLNVIYGASSHTTDLSAHFGGLVAGFLAGMLLIRRRTSLS
jgi:rhomboid protease GluP